MRVSLGVKTMQHRQRLIIARFYPLASRPDVGRYYRLVLGRRMASDDTWLRSQPL